MTRSYLPQKPWVRLSLGGALLVLALISGLLLALMGPLGRLVLIEAVDSRALAGFGTLQVDGVEGNVLSDFSISRVAVEDEDGSWLVIQDVRVQWSALSAVTGSIKVEAVDVAQIDVLHRPTRSERASNQSNGGTPPEFQLQRISVSEINLPDGVAGPAAQYALDGRLDGSRAGSLSAQLRAQRIDAVGDQIRVDFERSETGHMSGKVDVLAPRGGLLAEALRLGEVGWSLTATLTGALETGTGDFSFLVDNVPASSGLLAWRGPDWSLTSNFDPAAWPGLPAELTALLAGADITTEGQLHPLSIDILSAESNSLSIQARDLLRSSRSAVIQLSPAGTQPFDFRGLQLGSGSLSLRQHGPDRFDVRLDLINLAHPALSGASVFVEADVALEQGVLALTANGRADGLESDRPEIQTRLPVRAELSANAIYDLAEARLDVTAAEIRSPDWRATFEGEWAGIDTRPNGTVQVDLPAIEVLELGVAGPITLTGSIANEASPVVITAQSEALSAPSDAATALLGPLDARAELFWEDGGLRAPSIALETSAISLLAQASQTNAAWVVEGTGLIELQTLAIAGLDGQAATAFDLTFSEQGLSARIQAEADALFVGQQRIDAPTIRTQFSQVDGELESVWRLDAIAQDAALNAEGGAALAGDQFSLTIDRGRWGSTAFTGALERDGDRLVADVSVQDPSDRRPWQGTAQYQGLVSAPLDGRLSGSLDAEAWSLPVGSLSEASLQFDGPLTRLPVQLEANGFAQQDFTLSADGVIEVVEDGARASSSLRGFFGSETIRSSTPMMFEANREGFLVSTNLSVGEASFIARLVRQPSLSVTVSISDAPAEFMTELTGLPTAAGQWAFEADLTQTSGVWRGHAEVQLDNIRPEGNPDIPALAGQARLTLDENAQLLAEFGAGSLSLDGNLTKPGSVADLDILLAPGWRGEVAVNGPLDTLAQLYLPAGEHFTGRISGTANFAENDVTGEILIEDGLYRSETAGVRLQPFSLQADFGEDRLRITEARLGDGHEGLAIAVGEIGLTEDGLFGDGQIEFNRFQAVSRPELTVVASGTSQLNLRGRDLAVTGEAQINRLALTPTASTGPRIPEIEVVEINRPETLDPPYRRPIRISLDYRVHADDGLFVSSRTFNSEWSADVQVQGPLNRLSLSGISSLLRGQASLLTRVFDVGVGEITFDGAINRTRILLEGRHSRAGLDVTARAEGAITQPSISFSSDPALPEDEILSRLLFDQNTAALSPLQTAQLAAQLSGRNWLGALGSAGQRIGVERLDVREGANGQVALVGGRQIAENVYLELETSTAAALGAARIEWSITPDIVILSRLTGDTEGELAIRWRREFD